MSNAEGTDEDKAQGATDNTLGAGQEPAAPPSQTSNLNTGPGWVSPTTPQVAPQAQFAFPPPDAAPAPIPPAPALASGANPAGAMAAPPALHAAGGPVPPAGPTGGPAESFPQYVPPGASKRAGGGVAITALVLGISALVLAVIPFLCFAAFLPALAGMAFGIVALARRSPRVTMAVFGLALSVLSLLVSAGMSFLTVQIVDSITADIESSGGGDDFFGDALGDSLSTSTSGVGAMTVDAVPVDGTGRHGIATFTATGEGALTVVTLDADGEVVETIVDERAPYSGTLLYNAIADVEVTQIEITTSGPWTLDLLSSLSVPDLDSESSYAGSGDDVIYYGGEGGSAVLETGSSSYAWLYTSLTESGYDCEIDESSSCVFDLPPEGIFIQVLAVGDWTVSLDEGDGTTTGGGELTSA